MSPDFKLTLVIIVIVAMLVAEALVIDYMITS